MSIELKIKSKHLSAEAKIIRFEELKIKSKANKSTTDIKTLNNLSNHRKINVRRENRATFLARALIANKEYSTVEPSCTFYNNPLNDTKLLKRIHSMVNTYGTKVSYYSIKNWITYPYIKY